MSENKSKKVFVAMSGGVDSSVAALLLKKAGYDVVGVFMRSYNVDGCAERDAEDARRAAEKISAPFYIWDFEDEYKKRVVDYMVDGYRKGLTPNPDIMCNREIKFGLFLKKALSAGADYVATGHYVRLSPEFPISNFQFPNNSKKRLENSKIENSLEIKNYKLKIAKDENKDQSYFLWTLTQKQLKHCLFPVGDYLKSEVRKIAKKAGLPTADKKDSQGICFLGKVTLKDFLAKYIPPKAGAILTVSGKKIGEHSGVQFYTVGQRHIGLANRRLTQTERGLTQTKDFKPLYVAEKNIKANTLVVAEGDNPALYKKEIMLSNVNIINSSVLSLIRANGRMGVLTRVRYRQPLVPATLTHADSTQTDADKFPRESASQPATICVLFDVPQKAVAPGQSAVFYLPYDSSARSNAKEGASAKVGSDGLQMLGGGVIV